MYITQVMINYSITSIHLKFIHDTMPKLPVNFPKILLPSCFREDRLTYIYIPNY
jgi:hypothetical protein